MRHFWWKRHYPTKPTTTAEILEAAHALKEGETLPWFLDLTGQIISMEATDYGETVVLLVDGTAFTVWDLYAWTNLQVGDTVTVNGLIGNSSGILQIIQPGLLQTQVAERKLTVFAPASWVGVNAYTWEPEGLGSFPGVAMEAAGEGYQLNISRSIVNLLFSGIKVDGFRQYCSEITLESNGRDVTVWIAEDGSCQVRYESNDTPGFRVVGNVPCMGSWWPASDEGLMTQIASGVYQKTYKDLAPGTYEFRVTQDGTWENSWGLGGQNYWVSVAADTFDLTVTFTYLNGEGEISVQIDTKTVMGDVSGDGSVNMGDISKLYAHIHGTSPLTGEQALICADVNGDGRINMGDVSKLYADIRNGVVA